MNAYAYFPAVVYREEHPEWVDYTKQIAQKYYDVTSENGVLEQTTHMANDPEIRFLVDYLLASADTILRQQGYAMDRYELYLSGLWGQEVKCHGSTNIHVHKNSQISGWFFLETPEGGSYPVYHDPRMNKQMVELDYEHSPELTNASTQVHFNNVKAGTVLFANSWMQHQLTQNHATTETKSIHFIVSHRERPCSIC